MRGDLEAMEESLGQLIDTYVDVKDAVLSEGFAAEIDWQAALTFSEIDESDFLREGAWVILSGGMREAVIRSRFPAVSAAFLDWRCAKAIVDDCGRCEEAALSVFRHKRKIDAIISLASTVAVQGFLSVKDRVMRGGIEYLQTFDFIGSVTSYHLAKNLGLDVAKPDRHLSRVAQIAGFRTPQQLCEEISRQTGDSIPVVDVVIWRFATLNPGYQQWFAHRLR